MFELFLTHKNFLIQTLFSILLSLLFIFLKIPTFFLYGLYSYIHPDNLSNGVRAAIRRPESSDSGSGVPSKSNPELRKRGKTKEKLDFDESNAQIFRIKLDDAHLQSRMYSNEYRNSFTISFIAISCLFLQIYLNNGVEKSGFLESGIFVPVMLGIVGVSKLLILLARISFERSASRRLEKQLSVLCGILGVVLGNIGFAISYSLLDFNFGSIDGFGRFLISIIMGCLAGFLFMPATKNARSFWLGTDQLRSNLSMITCGWFGRAILYGNYLLMVLTVLLWINPFSEMLVNKNMGGNQIGNAERLLGNVGFSPSDFGRLRIWCLLSSSLFQVVALRPNLQMYLNEALLSWYQRLHASKVPDLEFSRAKVFLHNHYLCLVVLQFVAPPLLLLLFLGLSQVHVNSFDKYHVVCSLLPCSSFVKEVALFLAWWIIFLSAVYTSVTLMLFRRCNLYIS
ncbi:hypothetical protein UlMin_043553 [Ulmus minor]